MKVHFIAIGGAAMHNLAIALKKRGYQVSGSDDEIFEPSRTRLEQNGLLPGKMGWNASRISKEIDLIILGMHARKDNAELLQAQKIGVEVVSYPEFIYRECRDKKRVVIAGSHGKTTTTAMILHALKKEKMSFDYMAGAALPGFSDMVSLSDSDLIILEGDEYFSSPVDMKAKFLWYRPHLAVITGIAWDHINVYPTKESYNKSFEDFVASMENGGSLFYYGEDDILSQIVRKADKKIEKCAYTKPAYSFSGDKCLLDYGGVKYALSIFGSHNMQNLEAARLVCEKLGILADAFYKAMSDFSGAAKRLELIAENSKLKVFRDFAHSPSKLMATVKACREKYSSGNILAIMELHTFSSLNKNFLAEYRSCLDEADKAVVFFSPEVMAHKKLPVFTAEEVRSAFGRKDLVVITIADELRKYILDEGQDSSVLLLMSSGTFGGLDIAALAGEVTSE